MYLIRKRRGNISGAKNDTGDPVSTSIGTSNARCLHIDSESNYCVLCRSNGVTRYLVAETQIVQLIGSLSVRRSLELGRSLECCHSLELRRSFEFSHFPLLSFSNSLFFCGHPCHSSNTSLKTVSYK